MDDDDVYLPTPGGLLSLAYAWHKIDKDKLVKAGVIGSGVGGSDWQRFNDDPMMFLIKLPPERLPALCALLKQNVRKTGTMKQPQGWRCKEDDRMKIARFALALEKNEELMAENAAMYCTCEAFHIDVEVGYEWLTCLPDVGHADADWWEILER